MGTTTKYRSAWLKRRTTWPTLHLASWYFLCENGNLCTYNVLGIAVACTTDADELAKNKMIFVNLPIQSDVPIVAPMDSCCNCGSANDIQSEVTDLRRMPFFGLAGAEIKLPLPFPYCPACAKTARRRRPTVLGVAALSTLLAMVFGMGWLFAAPPVAQETIEYVVAPLVILLSLGVVSGLYWLRRPSGAQTSAYQPVVLKHTGHKWPADITGLELAFTNAAYAKLFEDGNRSAISAGKIKISRV